MSYLGDMSSDLCQLAVTVNNLTATVTGPALDMVTGDGRCNLVFGCAAGNFSYAVANVFQSAASTGTYTAITAATAACTTAGITAPVVFNRDYRWLQVRHDFAGTGVTGVQSLVIEMKKNANG